MALMSDWLQFWDSQIVDKYPAWLVVGLGTFVWHQVFWLFLNIPYMIIEDKKWFEDNKIIKDPSQRATSQQRWALLKVMLWDQHVMLLPLTLISAPLFLFLRFTLHSQNLPNWSTFAIQFLAFNVIEDTMFYWTHRLLHVPYFYKKVHYKHHEYLSPFTLAGEVAHPLEFLFGFLLPSVSGPFLMSFFHDPVHMFVFWLWIFFRETRSVDAHSGYFFKYHPVRLLPFYGGAKFHGLHHSLKGRQTNFGGYLIWDYLCGTLYDENQHSTNKKK